MESMAYTVRQVAGVSGVSIRTLHFCDEMGLLKPAYLGANGYRYYEEPQLLELQQILFYRGGTEKMSTEEMFSGFRVASGGARFEFTGSNSGRGGGTAMRTSGFTYSTAS